MLGPLQIDNHTSIKLYAVLAVLPFLVGGVLWLASIDAKASTAAKGINELQPVTLELIKETVALRVEVQLLREAIKHNR